MTPEERRTNRFALAVARVRLAVPLGAVVLVFVGPWLGQSWLSLVGFALLVVGMALYLRVGTVRVEPRPVAPPVTGRQVAVNGPGSKVPSHGIQAYGQTYAIDLIHVPEGTWSFRAEAWPLTRPPDHFVSFGRPVLAPIGGTVVRAHHRERDHRSRTSWPAIAYMFLEGFVRELTGPNRILGNNVVIDQGDGVYALVAHLRRKSVLVRRGERVEAGQQIAECGNSGNTSEPHVHFQLMDRPSCWRAAGLPFRFTRVTGISTSDPTAADAAVPNDRSPFVANP